MEIIESTEREPRPPEIHVEPVADSRWLQQSEIKEKLWKSIPKAEQKQSSFVKTSSLEAVLETIAGLFSELPQNAKPDVEEIYKESQERVLQQIVGLREEHTKTRLETIDNKLENLETKTALAKLEHKIQKNRSDIKSMKRNGCTKGQTHSIIKNEMEDGKIIILRRLFGGNVTTILDLVFWKTQHKNPESVRLSDR